jgi:hypothetical protein
MDQLPPLTPVPGQRSPSQASQLTELGGAYEPTAAGQPNGFRTNGGGPHNNNGGGPPHHLGYPVAPPPHIANGGPGPEGEPEVQTVRLSKTNGMGLSIVAAKGVGKERLGIYIKAVVEGGAAWQDGSLEAGDQLLRVDGQSLIGITQVRGHTSRSPRSDIGLLGLTWGLCSLILVFSVSSVSSVSLVWPRSYWSHLGLLCIALV